MEHIERQEFMDSQQRLHTRIDEINKAAISVEKSVGLIAMSVNVIKESSDKVHEVVFGNGKPGLGTRLFNALFQIKLQWVLLAFISFSILGSAFFIIRDHFKG